MQYWLLKSEPNVWSIDQQKKVGAKGVSWDGVRNYQAANNLKKMNKGDLCFFYHSNIGKEIVGVVEVIKTAFLDVTDEKNRFVEDYKDWFLEKEIGDEMPIGSPKKKEEIVDEEVVEEQLPDGQEVQVEEQVVS